MYELQLPGIHIAIISLQGAVKNQFNLKIAHSSIFSYLHLPCFTLYNHRFYVVGYIQVIGYS